MKKIFTVLLLLILLVSFSGCAKKEPGITPELVLDGHSIYVGRSTPDNIGLGVHFAGNSPLNPTNMPDLSWTSQLFLDDYLACITIANGSNESKPIGSCVVHEVEFFDLDEEKNRNIDVTINGVNPIGMTEEQLKEAYPELELDDEGEFKFDYLRSGSDYYVRFEYINGVQSQILVAHKFDKSYEEK